MDKNTVLVFFIFFILFLGLFSVYDYVFESTGAATFIVGKDIPLINPPDTVKQDDDEDKEVPSIIFLNYTQTEEQEETKEEIQEGTDEQTEEKENKIEEINADAEIIIITPESIQMQQPRQDPQVFPALIVGAILLSVVSVFIYEQYLRKEEHPRWRSMEELKKYVLVGLKRGHTINELKSALIKQNIPEDQINLVLKDLRKL